MEVITARHGSDPDGLLPGPVRSRMRRARCAPGPDLPLGSGDEDVAQLGNPAQPGGDFPPDPRAGRTAGRGAVDDGGSGPDRRPAPFVRRH